MHKTNPVGKVLELGDGVIEYTFGRGDETIEASYVNLWNVSVVDGLIDGKSSGIFEQGRWYKLTARPMEVYERFDGWTCEGPGSFKNTVSPSTEFAVGNGNATITANITEYPDKTLRVLWRHPSTNTDTVVLEETYKYGSRIQIEAETAPDKSTFLSWLGDVKMISPSALASTISIESLTADTEIIATYYYPEAPQYFTLTVYDGYPESGTYPAGSLVTVRAKQPSTNWEFYKWEGDTQFLVNQDITQPENAVIMPLQSLTLKAKFNIIGQEPLYRVSVTGGTASVTVIPETGDPYEMSGVYLDIPWRTQVKLTAEPDVVGWVFDRWEGNFDEAGVIDINKTANPTWFSMPEQDLEIKMIRREVSKYTVYTTNATGPGTAYAGTYPIAGNLRDTEDMKYVFSHWLCTDANGENCISAIKDPESVETEITLSDKNLWIEAVYTTYYRLTVVGGQDTGEGFYHAGEEVTTIYANTPDPDDRQAFDHWEDPMKVLSNIYDPTPKVTMKDTVAIITAVFTSTDSSGNSIIVTGDDIHDELITRTDSYLINGVYAVGALAFDKDGCLGVVTEVDPDKSDDTDDYAVEKLFYGGNF